MNDSRKRELIEMTLENYFTLHEDPVNDFQREYATQQLISEELSLDDMRISSNDAMKKFLGVIRDIRNEKYNRDEGGPNYPVNETLTEDGLVKVFESKMSELYPLIMRSDTITFTFYFPWNLHFDAETEFKELGVKISQISESDWQYVTDRFRANPKVSGVGNLESQITEGVFTFWKGEIEARGPDFAFIEFSDAIQLVCAKLNYANYRYDLDHASQRYEAKHRSIDLTGRWSEIQRPFGYLLKDHNGAFFCKIFDYDGRQPLNEDRMHREWRNRYDEFSSIGLDKTRTEELLLDVLLTYQSAFEADDSVDAFFKFWRALEEMTHVGRGEKADVIKRAMFCIDFVDPTRYDPLIRDIKDELWDVRNKWVHQSNWNDIYPYHEKTCKYLLDATIEFYLNELVDIKPHLLADVFRYATMDRSDMRRSEEAIRNLNSIIDST